MQDGAAALVTGTSLVLTGAVVAHAYFLKNQFYPTVVYLTKSSPSMAVSCHQFFNVRSLWKGTVNFDLTCLLFPRQVIYIQAFVLVFLLGKLMRKVFFGQLRAAEMEVGV